MGRLLQLGRRAVRTEGGFERGKPLEIDSDALVRHAFVCGASGFGKTVFCKGLVEEAVLAGIPVIAVDLKGDLASLALRGPLATAKGLRPMFGEEAPAIATEFEAGAIRADLDTLRAKAYAERSCVRIFTPNSSLGRRVALSALPSFPEPVSSPLEREERDELIQALVLGFAHTMYGTPAAVKKNEPAVKVVEELVRWCADRGEPLDGAAGIARILELVSGPPFDLMGGMGIDEYLPSRDKMRLMQKLNSRLLGAERTRYEGQRLTVETLLSGVPEGKTPLSIVYLGHISDFSEQSSVIGQLCADIYRYMRKAGGSSSVQLLVYLDELGGGDAKQAFYPSAPHNPPSKAPINLLVRQGRSAGISMLLATQNPVSVDVRGLGNINTWAIGRLTRKNDQARVEDLLSRLPGGSDEGSAIVSQLPQGVMLALSDAIEGPQYVFGRWLYSVHRQLSPAAVGAICAYEAEQSAQDKPSPKPSQTKTVERPQKPKPSQVETVEDIPKTQLSPQRLADHTKTKLAEPLRPPDNDKTQLSEAPKPSQVKTVEIPARKLKKGPPKPSPTLVPEQKVPLAKVVEEDDEETSAGTTRHQQRAIDPEAETDAEQTEAENLDLPTRGAVVAYDEVVISARELDEELEDTPKTAIHPTRKPRRTRKPPTPPPREPAEDDTDRLLASDLFEKTSIQRRPAPTPPQPEQTTWQAGSLSDEERLEQHTTWRPEPQPEGQWILRAGPRQWVVGARGLTLGRSPRADAQIADPHVSREHVQLQVVGRTLIVRRLNAKNPTFLDGKPLVEPVRVEPRDGALSLKLGDTEVSLSFGR